jgi:hypothetical protein
MHWVYSPPKAANKWRAKPKTGPASRASSDACSTFPQGANSLAAAADFNDEIQIHIDLLTERLISQGTSAEEARYTTPRLSGPASSESIPAHP